MIVYDCEIIKAIPPRGSEPLLPDIEYCAGWRDFEGMGVSVIGCYDMNVRRYRVFCKDNFAEFQQLVDDAEIVAGFNSIAFDNQLLAANGIQVPEDKSYDLLRSLWAAHGLGPKFSPRTHGGFGLDAFAKANGLEGKTGHGALAPVQWQRGEIGSVIDYCLEDVRLTKLLIEYVMTGDVVSPKTGATVAVEPPAVN